jgi:hypothetical protein
VEGNFGKVLRQWGIEFKHNHAKKEDVSP